MTIEMEKYNCPYCDRESVSPGGVRWHVSVEHPEKMQEFVDNYYSEMTERFKTATIAA